MNYKETIDYLFTQLPMYQRIGPAAYKKDLTNTLHLLEILGNPHNKFSAIHVAGTNGKGSVSNMLCSVLMEAGYSTGLYTSPHLIDFRERIRINGVMCEKEFVIAFVEKIKPHLESIKPSFFEITVAMAFDYFVAKEIDIAVVEVGLGGRLDSTNVITPLLSVITNISFDHRQMLGNTIAEISAEKAGIIKENIPVVIGEYHEESFPVFLNKSAATGSELYLAEENISTELLFADHGFLEVNATYLGQLFYPSLLLDLPGLYQLKNIKTLIQSIEVLRLKGVEILEESVYEGLKNVKKNTGFAGRWQILAQDPTIICDCAHNSSGLSDVFEQLRSTNIQFKQLRIVTGAVNDKDLNEHFVLFPTSAEYYFCKPDIPRGLDAATLQLIASKYGLKGKNCETVKNALEIARKESSIDDLILICGSIFVVAEALEAVEKLAID